MPSGQKVRNISTGAIFHATLLIRPVNASRTRGVSNIEAIQPLVYAFVVARYAIVKIEKMLANTIIIWRFLLCINTRTLARC